MANSEGQVVARVKGPSGEIFPQLARAVLGMYEDAEICRNRAVSMLTDMVYCFGKNDPLRWKEPPEELAMNPLVFEALQWARIRLMK